MLIKNIRGLISNVKVMYKTSQVYNFNEPLTGLRETKKKH